MTGTSAVKLEFSGNVWWVAIAFVVISIALSLYALDWARALILSGTMLQIAGAIATGAFSFFGWHFKEGKMTQESKGYHVEFSDIVFSGTWTRWGYWGFLYIILGLCLVAAPALIENGQAALTSLGAFE